MRAGEVLEAVPGVIISQHSGEGKANQYYLRGFNLDHGTDFATTVAGMPVNLPTHAHGQGYSDLNFLIPELVTGVQFRKGPYFAQEGDFSAAGSANINYANVLAHPIATVSAGQDGWGRRPAGRVSARRTRHGGGRARAEPQRRTVDDAGRLRKVQRGAAVQPRRNAERLLADRARLQQLLELDRSSARTRDRRWPHLQVRAASTRPTAGQRRATAPSPTSSARRRRQ